MKNEQINWLKFTHLQLKLHKSAISELKVKQQIAKRNFQVVFENEAI